VRESFVISEMMRDEIAFEQTFFKRKKNLSEKDE
jgi:hypothetical protein